MNWGKGITIFMIAFMTFIISMVYYTFTKNADLIEEDYYENEVNYDHNKESENNYHSLAEKLTMTQEESGIVFKFPSTVAQSANGKITFYRPDAKKLDREFDLQLDTAKQQVIDYSNFKEGYYDVIVEWTDGQKDFTFKEGIQF